jgi:hypothetical protein
MQRINQAHIEITFLRFLVWEKGDFIYGKIIRRISSANNNSPNKNESISISLPDIYPAAALMASIFGVIPASLKNSKNLPRVSIFLPVIS